jgi:hypothetical protein
MLVSPCLSTNSSAETTKPISIKLNMTDLHNFSSFFCIGLVPLILKATSLMGMSFLIDFDETVCSADHATSAVQAFTYVRFIHFNLF